MRTLHAPAHPQLNSTDPVWISYPCFTMTVQSQDGERQTSRKPVDVHRPVLGIPNRPEYELGFLVHGGDGLADLMPIAHLYRSRVYPMAASLGLPDSIQNQTPSTGTHALLQSQEEEAAAAPGSSADQTRRVYKNTLLKRRSSARIPPRAALAEAVAVDGSDA